MFGRLVPFAGPMTLFFKTRQIEVATALYGAIVFAYVGSGTYTSIWLGLAVPFLGLAAVATQSRSVRFWAVLGLAAIMAGLVAANYYISVNHGFMLIWVGLGLALACACDPGRDEVVLRRNAMLLISLLMFLALIQKLRSAYYIEGDLLGGYIMQGGIFYNLLGWALPDWPGLVAEYRGVVAGLLEQPEAASVAVMVPAAVVALAWRMTMTSLVAQAVLEVMILFRARLGMVLHLAILGFVALVYATRNENLFLSVNCWLGYAMTDEKSAAIRPWYVVAIIYLLTTTHVGLRPWAIS
jgi:hypothetical protein